MKKLFNVCRNVFAVIGIIAVIVVILFICARPYFDIDVYPNRLGMMEEYVDSLRTSGHYAKDTTSFSFKIIQNEARAQEIKDYFQLDTLYTPDADTWTKALAIGKFVSSNIPHANQREWPESVDAIGLWEYTKNVEPAFNCRLHGIFAFELLLAAGIEARYVTCMPEDAEDNDCHVVNEIWLPELGKDIILFIEEVEESMHNIDRQFNILAMNGVLDRCQASDALRQERAHTESLKRTIFVS